MGYAYDKEIRGALEVWERKLTGIIAGKKAGKVISISRKRRKVA